MTQLLFFEKPGCATNARQKQVLRDAGVEFEARSLLTQPWTKQQLLAFFGALPVAQWFNRAAPRVKSGEIDPETIDADAAIACMLAEPLLIRRPLLQRGDWRAVGFDWAVIAAQLGIATASASAAAAMANGVLEGCSHGNHDHKAHCAVPDPSISKAQPSPVATESAA